MSVKRTIDVAVHFDFDGLIADTEPLYCKAFRKVLDPLGVRFT
jgi:beta-phosphoglucomutase-like phosphatase (HAD superfamily)